MLLMFYDNQLYTCMDADSLNHLYTCMDADSLKAHYVYTPCIVCI